MSEITFRRPTFKNPLPTIIKSIGAVLMSIFVSMIALGESAGRARAANELARLGYIDEAKAIMLGEEDKC